MVKKIVGHLGIKKNCICTDTIKEYTHKMSRYNHIYYSTTENIIDHCTLSNDMLQEILHQVHIIFVKHLDEFRKKILENKDLSENEKAFFKKWDDHNTVNCYCDTCRIKELGCACLYLNLIS